MGTPQVQFDPSAAYGAAQPKSFNPAEAYSAATSGDTGETRDDVGNKIIVPKEAESFADTMNRAVEYGKTITPEQITSQAKRGMKDDLPAVLAAAPVMGAVGSAVLAGVGEVGSAVPGAAQKLLHFTESQLEQFAEAYPHLSKLAETLGVGSGIAGAYKLFGKIMGPGK